MTLRELQQGPTRMQAADICYEMPVSSECS
jgi:hypothetical protein